MDIAVLIKYVPDSTAKITVSGDRLNESAVSKWSISPFDEYALEAAFGMKESAGASVTAITCGPTRSYKGLRDAAAGGADSLVHVSVDDLTSLDSTVNHNSLIYDNVVDLILHFQLHYSIRY